jgi:hypothetical protein
MALTVDGEAITRARQSIDFEKQSDRLKTNNNLFTFPDPNLETLEKYIYYLLKNSEKVDFDGARYTYRPDYVSYDFYGTPSLDKVIMFVNGIRTVENFTGLKSIVVPSLEAITYMLKDNYDPYKDVADMDSVGW